MACSLGSCEPRFSNAYTVTLLQCFPVTPTNLLWRTQVALDLLIASHRRQFIAKTGEPLLRVVSERAVSLEALCPI